MQGSGTWSKGESLSAALIDTSSSKLLTGTRWQILATDGLGQTPTSLRKRGGKGKGKKRTLLWNSLLSANIFANKLRGRSGNGKSRCSTSARWHKWRANIWWLQSELLLFTFNKVWLKDSRAKVSPCQVLHKRGKEGKQKGFIQPRN